MTLTQLVSGLVLKLLGDMLVFLHVGRVLNRFSKDVGFLDDVLPFIFCEYLLVSVSYGQKFKTVHGFIV